MNYLHQQRYAQRIINISRLFSSYHQKKLIVHSYNNFKTKKKYNDVLKIYENWLTRHNINY